LFLFVLAVLLSLAFDKHLFCYFLSLEIFVFSVLYVLGYVCISSHQPAWFLIFICMAVVESVLGLCLYLSFVRLHSSSHFSAASAAF